MALGTWAKYWRHPHNKVSWFCDVCKIHKHENSFFVCLYIDVCMSMAKWVTTHRPLVSATSGDNWFCWWRYSFFLISCFCLTVATSLLCLFLDLSGFLKILKYNPRSRTLAILSSELHPQFAVFSLRFCSFEFCFWNIDIADFLAVCLISADEAVSPVRLFDGPLWLTCK